VQRIGNSSPPPVFSHTHLKVWGFWGAHLTSTSWGHLNSRIQPSNATIRLLASIASQRRVKIININFDNRDFFFHLEIVWSSRGSITVLDFTSKTNIKLYIIFLPHSKESYLVWMYLSLFRAIRVYILWILYWLDGPGRNLNMADYCTLHRVLLNIFVSNTVATKTSGLQIQKKLKYQIYVCFLITN